MIVKFEFLNLDGDPNGQTTWSDNAKPFEQNEQPTRTIGSWKRSKKKELHPEVPERKARKLVKISLIKVNLFR